MYMIVLRLPGYCRNALHADMHTCSTQTRFDCSVFAYALQWESFSAEIGVVSASCSRTKIETICPESRPTKVSGYNCGIFSKVFCLMALGIRWTLYTQREVTSQSLWSRYDGIFAGIRVFKRYYCAKHLSEILPTRWRQKLTVIDMEQNYVSVTLCSGGKLCYALPQY